MRQQACPDQKELQDLLLGKSIREDRRLQLEEHFLDCPQCAASSESINAADDFTKAIQNKKAPTGDEVLLQSVISNAKGLASLLDTVNDVNELTLQIKTEPETPRRTRQRSDQFDFLAPAQQPDEIGRLGNYRILKVLGIGGMGIVFRAEDILLKRDVALKAMKPKNAVKAESKARFIREAQATASLSSDHIVQIYQVGEERGTAFIAMQYLEGQSLQSVLKRAGKLKAIDAVRIGREVAMGLAAAHEKGLIHRDVKPDNIWIEAKTNRAKILDFGLARHSATDEELTQAGAILGTPSYMAPEQIQGQTPDPRCDLFSLGSMLYHLVTGERAFKGSSLPGLLYAIMHSSPDPIEKTIPDIYPPLASLIMQMLAKNPDGRPQSAVAVESQLKQIESTLRANKRQSIPATPVTALPKLKNSSGKKPPNRRTPWIALASGAFFAFLFGIIVITIRNRNGEETTIKVPEGTALNLELQPDSQVTLREEPAGTEERLKQPLSMTPKPEKTPSDSPAKESDAKVDLALNEEAQYPPLVEWLAGRKQLTVAQNGSAMYSTIHDALNAQKEGEVVRILDKGPYRESLRWDNKRNGGLVADPGTIVELDKWSTETPEDTYIKGHHFSELQDMRIHGIDFLCKTDFKGICSLIFGTNIDGLCIENCVLTSTDLGMEGELQAINIYSTGWANVNAKPEDFKGNCVRNCAIATDRIILLEGGGTTYFSQNLIMFGAAPEEKIYSLGFFTYPSKLLHTLLLSKNVFVHHGGVSQFYLQGDPNSASRMLFRNNTFHGETQNLAVMYESAVGQNYEFVDNLAIGSSSYIFTDPKYLPPNNPKFQSRGNLTNRPQISSGQQTTLFTPAIFEIKTSSPLDRDSLRMASKPPIAKQEIESTPGALPLGLATGSGDWFTKLQERFEATTKLMTNEARSYWTRPINEKNSNAPSSNR